MIFKSRKKLKEEFLRKIALEQANLDKDIPKNKKVAKSDYKEKAVIPEVIDTGGSAREKKKYEKLSRWQRRKLKQYPATSFLIRMNFSNGTSREFVIKTRAEVFKYMKRWYYLRYEDSWFNLTQNQYELNYFDDYPVPLDRKIIKQGNKAYWSVTPDNLKPIIDMEYVKALASSQELDRYLRMNATLTIFMVFLIMFILYYLFKINKAIGLLPSIIGN